MTRNMIASAAFVALLGASAFAASPASAQVEHRCDANGCWTVNCDEDGYCPRVWRGDRHYYSSSSYYRGNGYYDGNQWVPYDRQNYRRHWVCDAWGGDCHYSYEVF